MITTVYHPDAEVATDYHRHLSLRHSELDVSSTCDPEELARLLPDSEVLICFRPPVGALAKAEKLRWLHYMSAGVDALLPARAYLQGVSVTNFAGRPSVADYAMGAILMQHWNFRKLIDDQRATVWDPYKTAPLGEYTIGIIGLGSIGQDLARRAAGFSMTVLGMRRSPEPVSDVSQVFQPAQLAEFLPQCDFVILTLPGTEETRNFIGETEFKQMKNSAFLINVGRGDIVDQDALIRTLQTDQIAGAALDVFEQEPLPRDNPLWQMENVIISPHIAGATSRYVERVVARFGETLDNYRRGEPLPYTVDLELGY